MTTLADRLNRRLLRHVTTRRVFVIRLTKEIRADFSLKGARRFRVIESTVKPSILRASECYLYNGPGRQSPSLLTSAADVLSPAGPKYAISNTKRAFTHRAFWADEGLERGTVAWVENIGPHLKSLFSSSYDPIAFANPTVAIASGAITWLKEKTKRTPHLVGFALGSGIEDLFVFAHGSVIERIMRTAIKTSRKSAHYLAAYGDAVEC